MQSHDMLLQEIPNIDSVLSLRKWRESIGISDTTCWRWEKAGWISPIRIANKKYLTKEDLEQFYARAKAGEFAVEPSGVCARAKQPPAAESAPKGPS